MAPTFLNHLVSKISARVPDTATRVFDNGPLAASAILLARDTPTATSTAVPHSGVTNVAAINNKGIFALFGILGAAICVGMIWFFFWAKNGGFHFRDNDWDDYKSTVLRRKGPNGTILSNATRSTKLGGGSVYKDVDDYTEDGRTVITDVTGTTASSDMTGITAGASDIAGREKRRKKREQRDRERERERERRREEKQSSEKSTVSDKSKRERKDKDKKERKDKKDKKDKKSRSSRKVNEQGVLIDEEAEAAAEAYLRDYRHEKAARVGGINTASDSSTWDGSNPSASTVVTDNTEGTESTVTSELMSNRERTPTSTPKKSSGAGGIRKVYSTADRNALREEERLRSEARRQERSERGDRGDRGKRASHSYTAALTHGESSRGERGERVRRDFSFKYGEDVSTPLRQIEEGSSRADYEDAEAEAERASPHMRGGYAESGVDDSDLGTKSYHCFIPGLSTGSAVESASDQQDFAYVEEKRKQRKERSSRRH